MINGKPIKNATYKDALLWIVTNEGGPYNKFDPTITICMVADLWGKTDAEVVRDLQKAELHLRGESLDSIGSI